MYSEWMDGPMSGVDPDQVENDIGAMWRTLYKMEKSFSECPSPLKMAQKVRNALSTPLYMHVHECIYNVCVHIYVCTVKFLM